MGASPYGVVSSYANSRIFPLICWRWRFVLTNLNQQQPTPPVHPVTARNIWCFLMLNPLVMSTLPTSKEVRDNQAESQWKAMSRVISSVGCRTQYHYSVNLVLLLMSPSTKSNTRDYRKDGAGINQIVISIFVPIWWCEKEIMVSVPHRLSSLLQVMLRRSALVSR